MQAKLSYKLQSKCMQVRTWHCNLLQLNLITPHLQRSLVLFLYIHTYMCYLQLHVFKPEGCVTGASRVARRPQEFNLNIYFVSEKSITIIYAKITLPQKKSVLNILQAFHFRSSNNVTNTD